MILLSLELTSRLCLLQSSARRTSRIRAHVLETSLHHVLIIPKITTSKTLLSRIPADCCRIAVPSNLTMQTRTRRFTRNGIPQLSIRWQTRGTVIPRHCLKQPSKLLNHDSVVEEAVVLRLTKTRFFLVLMPGVPAFIQRTLICAHIWGATRARNPSCASGLDASGVFRALTNLRAINVPIRVWNLISVQCAASASDALTISRNTSGFTGSRATSCLRRRTLEDHLQSKFKF